MHHKRETQSVTYTSPRDYVFQIFLEFGIEGHFSINYILFVIDNSCAITAEQ